VVLQEAPAVPQLSDHAKGLLLTTSGMLVLTPDSLLILLAGLEPWQTMVWRGYLQAIGITLLVLIFNRGASLAAFRAIGIAGLFAAVTITVSTAGFLFAVANTSVANALVIVAAAPFFAAAFSFIFLGERVAPRTWVAIAFTFLGIAVLGWGSLGGGELLGDLAALMTSMSLGIYFTIVRHARGVVMVPAVAVGGFLSGTVGLFMGGYVWPEGETMAYLLIMGFFVLPVSTALITLGPRYITASEVALIFLLETFLGPIWVWVVLNQMPSTPTFIGGAIVIVTLTTHAVLGLRSNSVRDAPAAKSAQAPRSY
jgi:drug/metabolite transporter (DMT)-like permease